VSFKEEKEEEGARGSSLEKRDLEDLEIFYQVVNAGSMSAAGRELGISPTVVSRRLQKLEDRLGVRLLQRTTRRIAKTEIGAGFYDRVVTVLRALEEAETFVRGRSPLISGTLKVSVPTSFGRLHVAPWLKGLLEKYPDLTIDIELSDGFSNIVAEGFDLAIRISAMVDAPLVTRRLCPNHRVICAAPSYLRNHGTPNSLDDLRDHKTLSASNNTTWLLDGPNGRETLKTKSFIITNSSDLVREETLAGLGIALRSTWDVGTELKRGKLKRILPQYRGSSDVAIHAVYPSSRQLPSKVRAFVDYFAKIYGTEPYWDKGLSL
jgi:DNA-binding transcriptional LysR family regulator